MPPITAAIEIKRPPEEVFAYVADLARHDEWQSQIREITVETDGPTRVGTRSREKRKMPGGPTVTATYEITEFEPPRRASFRGVDGPVRVLGTVTVSPAEGGSRVGVEIDLVGHGIGKLLALIGRRQLRKQVPLDQQRLKERLESQSSG